MNFASMAGPAPFFGAARKEWEDEDILSRFQLDRPLVALRRMWRLRICYLVVYFLLKIMRVCG